MAELEFLVILLLVAVSYMLGYITLIFILANCISVIKLMALHFDI
jgi:hypothetical protein